MTAITLLGATPGVDIAAAVKAYEETERTAWAVYEETRRTAWEQLLTDVAGDPLAAWIVQHAMPTYQAEALTVLKALPATLEQLDQLDQLADQHAWCGTWADQVTAARIAGVIPAETSQAVTR